MPVRKITTPSVMRGSVPKGVPVPSTGTRACRDFFLSFRKIEELLLYIISMSSLVDRVTELTEELVEIGKEADPELDWPGGLEQGFAVRKLVENGQVLMEVVLARHIENYLNYLSSLLYEIFTQRPETLKSSEKVELSVVVSHSSIGELVRSLAESKVEALSYQSFSDLARYFEDHFNLRPFEEAEMPLIIEAIETRNISVHNRCIINRRYVAKTHADPARMGKVRVLGLGDVQEVTRLLVHSVARLDREARSKLKLKATRFGRSVFESILHQSKSPDD